MPQATDIFAMLREGRREEALLAARELYTGEPDNLWNLRALVRSLCKSLWETQDAAQGQSLAAELAALPALPPGERDDALTDYRARAMMRADPLTQRLQVIREMSRRGEHTPALQQLRQIHWEHPERQDVDVALAWEIWHILVEAVREEEPDKGAIRSLLSEYYRLRIEKPSRIHSLMLDVAARAAHKKSFPSFCGFLRWWDPVNMREEDFIANPGADGRAFPSVVEHVIQGLGKAVKTEPQEDLLVMAAAFIEQHYSRYPEQEKWFPYYLASAWIKTGRKEDAKSLLIPVVLRNQGQPWAWHQLALCLEPADPLHLACLCRALLCPGQEAQFLLKIRVALGSVLLSAGRVAEAKHEVEEIMRVRGEHGWPITGELLALTRAEWFGATVAKNWTEDCRAWAADADWAIQPRTLALALWVNPERGITTAVAENGANLRWEHDMIPVARTLAPGTIVQFNVITTGQEARVGRMEVWHGSASSKYWRPYGAPFRPRQQKGGGHAGDVFVPALLADGFVQGRIVSGMAFMRTGLPAKRSWWEAVSARCD